VAASNHYYILGAVKAHEGTTMTEPKSSEQYIVESEEVQEAMDMLGKGYEHEQPSVEIVPPHAVMERRGKEFHEVIKPAFVKISTDFKEELKEIDDKALKVWLFISLSVNRYSGKANPGLRTIAKGCNLAINTVRSAIERLENDYGLLTVDRESTKYNIYEPVAFVSANRSEPVSTTDTVAETVSIPDETVSKNSQTVSISDETVSPRLILNQRNQRNQKNQKRGDLVDGFIELSRSPGIKRTIRLDAIASQIGQRLHINPSTKKWDDFLRFVDDRQQKDGQDFEHFLDWLTSQPNFDVSYWPPNKMQEHWPRAFVKQQTFDQALKAAGYV